MAWHLTYRVPLHFVAIPETEIAQACGRFNLSLEAWTRQEGVVATLRREKGHDIGAACGQLRLQIKRAEGEVRRMTA